MLSWRRRRHGDPRRDDDSGDRAARTSWWSSRIRAQALFYEVRPETILVDCIVLQDRYTGPDDLVTGQPFSFEVGMPGDSWMVPALASLERWTSSGTPLELEPRMTRQGPRLLVSDTDAVVRFDLDALLIA